MNDCLSLRITVVSAIPNTSAVIGGNRCHCAGASAVIASVAKQSIVGAGTLHGLLRYARNDGSYS